MMIIIIVVKKKSESSKMLVQKFISLNFFPISFFCTSMLFIILCLFTLYVFLFPSLHVFKRAASRYSKLCLYYTLPSSLFRPSFFSLCRCFYLFVHTNPSFSLQPLSLHGIYIIRFAWHTHLLYQKQQKKILWSLRSIRLMTQFYERKTC